MSLLTSALALSAALLLEMLLMFSLGQTPEQGFQVYFHVLLGQNLEWNTISRKIVPLIFTGLSVAIALRAGLFNFGVAGQFLIGTLCALYAGVKFPAGTSPALFLTTALAAGFAGGMVWSAIPGLLKAATGAHEVITTVMLNYVAAFIASWVMSSDSPEGGVPSSLPSNPTADSIVKAGEISSLHQSSWIQESFNFLQDGVLLAIAAAILTWWLLERTALGFEIKTIGHKPNVARYAGMRVAWTTVQAMGWAGGMAGIAGALVISGLNYRFAAETRSVIGFDGLTVALLGHTHPVGIVAASLLLGCLSARASSMQIALRMPVDPYRIVQAVIIIFVSAPYVTGLLLRLAPLARWAGFPQFSGVSESR